MSISQMLHHLNLTMEAPLGSIKPKENQILLQKEVSTKLGIGYTNYNKIETGIREPSVKELQKLAKLYRLTVDKIINLDGDIPKEVTIENEPAVEQLHLLQQLDE